MSGNSLGLSFYSESLCVRLRMYCRKGKFEGCIWYLWTCGFWNS